MPSPLKRLGAILQLLREDRGLAVDELASRAGVEPSLLREVESAQGVAPIHLLHLDQILEACDVSLRELARADQRVLLGVDASTNGDDETATLLRTIESLQERIEELERERADRTSATMRSFQKRTIRLLERTMETSGLTPEEMRRLVSDMQVEDVS